MQAAFSKRDQWAQVKHQVINGEGSGLRKTGTPVMFTARLLGLSYALVWCLITDFVSTDKEKAKEKLEEDEAAAASTMAVSASLMPPIWDKTIPYDGESFHLEYMDLDEFLLENGIPASPTHLVQNLLLPVAELEGKESASSSTASPPSSSTAVFQPSETVSSTGW